MPQTRNTIQRQLVLDAVQQMHNHPTAEEIYLRVAKHNPTISRATVYRNLAFLAHRGDIRRVSHLNAADRFDFHTEPHYHFRCSGCGQVFDVDLPYDGELLERVQNPGEFHFDGYELTFHGLCPDCQDPKKTS